MTLSGIIVGNITSTQVYTYPCGPKGEETDPATAFFALRIMGDAKISDEQRQRILRMLSVTPVLPAKNAGIEVGISVTPS